MAACTKCNGEGVIDREKSEIDQKEEFAKPLFEKTICDRCGGSGQEPKVKRSAELMKSAKTASALTQARAEHVGSEGYVWRTAKDFRVRPDHRVLEGTFHKWLDPPIVDKKSVKYNWSGKEFEHGVTNFHVFPSILDGTWGTIGPLELQIEIEFRDDAVLDIVKIQKKLAFLHYNYDTCSVYFDGICYPDVLLRSINHYNHKMIIDFMQVIRLTDLQMGGLSANT